MNSKPVGNHIKMFATALGVMVVFSTLLAGVMDTQSRVHLLERDQNKLSDRVENQSKVQMEQYDMIRDALYELKLGQAILRQRIDSQRTE